MYIYVTKTKEFYFYLTTQSQSRSRSLISNKYIINIISVSKSSSPSILNLKYMFVKKKKSLQFFIYFRLNKDNISLITIINNR